MKRESIKVTRTKLRDHAKAMALTRDTAPDIYRWHLAEYNRLRHLVLEHEAKQKPLAPEVREARDRRWAFFGAIGSVNFACHCFHSVHHRLRDAGEEAQQLAVRIEQDLTQLTNLLNSGIKRKSDGHHF